MKTITILSLLFLINTTYSFAQVEARPDTFCIMSNETIVGNVKDNDFSNPPNNPYLVYFLSNPNNPPNPCFEINHQTGVITLNSDMAEECCGEHRLKYAYETPQGQMIMATVDITIKCPKPNCMVIDLDPDDAGSTSGGAGNGKTIFYACEDTPITYYVDNIPGYTYTWSNSAAAPITPGSNPAEIFITWPNPGTYTVTLVTNTGTGTTTEMFCIEVLAAPVAAFTTSMNCVCLNSPISFTNTSTGASSYYWDFGDGNNSTMPNPTHTYNTPGTYTVTLYAYNQNYDPMGNPLCCCTDSTQMIITVDEKPGPNIYWISTLCEGDSSKYWTDASGCNFTWAVSGNGTLVSGQGNDTICVVWGAGPFGQITLTLSGCSPAIWCEKPVTVQVPIISTVEFIDGDIQVCAGSKEIYSLPKWAGTIYDWTVTGGMIVSGDSSHQVIIMWGNGPTGTIHVDYWNPFLQCLPEHDEEDCKGVADLDVNIRPEYDLLTHPTIFCLGDTYTFSTDTPAPPLGFTFIITPPTGPNITLINNQSITYTWPQTGLYNLCVYPNDPSLFCNDTICTSISVIGIDPIDSISGEKLICPNETYTYTAHSNESNVKYNWVVTGGTIVPAIGMGNPVMITWNNTGPYSISVTQEMLNDPFCESLPYVCPVVKKQVNGPLTLTTSPSCINIQSNYSIGPPQQPGATFNWSIAPASAGSVIAGQGSPNITVQWNNTPGNVTLNCWVKICNDSLLLSQMLLLKAPIAANISQIGMLCPGVSVQLNAGAGPYTSANWTPAAVGTTITVSTPGLYVVTTTDMMGCQSTDSYQLNSLPGPLASISTAGPTTICTTAVGTIVVLQALINPNYQYQWYDQFNNPIGGATMSTYTYTSTGVLGIFSFKVKITDMMTGCMSFSNWITIIQSACGGGGGGTPCIPVGHNVNLSLVPNTPQCEKITFNYTDMPIGIITPISWSYGDPFGTVNMPGPVNAMFTYSQAGTYPVCLTYTVPAQGGGVCTLQQCGVVNIPIVANFYTQLTQNCREVKFINTTSTQLGVVVTNYNWNYGDGNFFNTNNINVMPTHTYATSGSYLVTLTATTTTGCIAIDTMTVNVLGPVPASYTVSMDTVCVGDPVAFTFTGNPADVLTYLYNFGDLSNNGGPNPSHSYSSQGLYVTSLTITDVYNCTNTVTQNIFVHPALNLDTISYVPDLTVCFGDSVTLTAPGLPSFTFNWSGGQTTQSITVNTTGWHHVTVTDNNGCMDVTDSVEVVILPPPIANISGPQVVCDSGCITLNATLGFNYNYQWFDENGDTIPFAVNASLQLCTGINFTDSVYVIVTDTTYFCSDTSAWWPINIVVSPDVVINVIGSLCAGSPNLLTAVATPPSNVIFTWSNGDIGPSIITYQAGTYTVYATDTLTGCSGDATVIVNPLPDLCAVPSGCYEVCDDKMLCGPLGLQSYQWNFNGVPIPGATNPCINVNQTGSYSLTATNNFGCSATSDTLILVVIPCCEVDDTEVIATPISISGQECCYKLSYANSKDSIMTITINTANANIQALAGSLPTPFQVIGFTANTVTIGNVSVGTPLPKDTLTSFVTICATNVTSSPALILIDWNWPNYDALCQDSVWFECHTSDTCVYVKNDTVICRSDGSYLYVVQVCNGSNNTWPITYLDIVELTPPGVIVSPGFYNTNILPGTCQTFSFVLTGSNLANQSFCYNLLAHENNPVDDPNARCCSLDTAHCIFLPGCGPCDSLYVEHITPSEDDSCCYTLTLNNYHDANTYFGIGICALNPGTTLSLNNPGIIWSTDDLQASSFILGYIPGTIPLGGFNLPEFCVASSSFSFNDIEVKWLGYGIDGYITLCSDTIETYCPNDCGYWEEISTECNPATGGYIFGLTFHNTSPFTIYSASINFINPVLPGNNTIINFPGGVVPNGSYGPVFINVFGTGLNAGDSLCIETTLHNSEGENPTSCCQFKSIIVIPDCGLEHDCECDKEFESLADIGIGIMINGLTVTFTPPPGLTECDKVIWELFYNQTSYVTFGNSPFTHTFPVKGVYEICVTIIRTTPSGEECKIKIVETVNVKPAFNFKIHPNPATNALTIEIETDGNTDYMQTIEVFNTNGERVIKTNLASKGNGQILLPIETINPGMYNLRITNEENEVIYKRFIKAE